MNFTSPSCSKRNCTQPQVVCTGGRAGSHTNPASSSLQFVYLVPSRRVARARLGTHSCAAPREKEECTVDRVCHVSLRAGMCSPGELSDKTHSMSPTQKSERTHETRVRRTILTSRNTNTSGNSFIHSQIHTSVGVCVALVVNVCLTALWCFSARGLAQSRSQVRCHGTCRTPETNYLAQGTLKEASRGRMVDNIRVKHYSTRAQVHVSSQ